MGESFNTFQSQEPPLRFADERVIFIPRHRRLDVENNDFKFIIVLEGSADLEIDGRPLGRLRRGDVLVVPLACKQTYSPTTREELRLHVMRIYFDVWRDPTPVAGRRKPAPPTEPASDRPDLREFLREQFRAAAIFTPPAGSRLHDWVREIQMEIEQRPIGHGLRIGALCRMIVVEVARGAQDQAAPRPPSAGAPDRSRPATAERGPTWATEHVKQYLYENYARPLALDHIAWEVRLSSEHLCRRFKRQTGQTVFSYLRQLRVDAAKSYLISSKLSVTEIAQRVGFSSATLLCRTFRQAVGLSPDGFRRANVARISFEPTSLRPDQSLEDSPTRRASYTRGLR
jgi:AraC-like DNA-binding protein